MDSSCAAAKAMANADAKNEASSKILRQKTGPSLSDEADSKICPLVEKSMSEEVQEKTDEPLVDPTGSSPPKANQDESNVVPDSSDSDDEIPLVSLGPLQDSSNKKNNEPNDEEGGAEEEYECKYCHRKFTNKQSLGGHQNAHKLERALEKEAAAPREVHETKVGGYTGGGSSSYPRMNSPTLFSGTLKRSHEVMSMSRGFYTQQLIHQPGMKPGGNYARPAPPPLSMNNEQQQPYAPRPVTGYFRPQPTWTVPVTRVTPYADPPSFLQHLPLTLQLSTTFAGSSFSGPVTSQGLSGFTDPRTAPGGNSGRPNNNQQGNAGAGNNNDDDDDDSGLDLTLRL